MPRATAPPRWQDRARRTCSRTSMEVLNASASLAARGVRCRRTAEPPQNDRVLDATGIDRDDALPGHRDVAAPSVRHFESVTAPMPNPQLRVPTSVGHNPGDRSPGPGAHEADPQPRAMPEVR